MTIPIIALQWNQTSAAAWEGLLATADGPTAVQQHWAYGAATAALGRRVERAVVQAGGRAVGLVQVQVRTWGRVASLALAMRGPVWLGAVDAAAKAEAYRHLRRELPRTPLHVALWTPEGDDAAALRRNRMRAVVTPYHTAVLDLAADEASLAAALHGKWRNRLRAAERSGLAVERVGLKPQQYEWLLTAEARQQQAKRYGGLPPGLVPLLQRHAGRDSLSILKAVQRREAVAGMLCLRHGNSATYHIGWSSEAGKRANAHNLLMWHTMLRLKAAGVRWFDLGGIATDTAPGLARFKLGTGAAVHSLAGTYF